MTASPESLGSVSPKFSQQDARQLAIFSGLGLVAWILVQLLWMQVFHPVMHPLIGGAGIAITILGWMLPPKAGLLSQRHVPGHTNA
jgi:uncharacterized membrane protein